MRRLVVSLLILIGWMSVCPARAWAQQIEWIRQFGTPSRDLAFAVSADASGVYVAGERGASPQLRAPNLDAFVREYDLDGSEVWARKFGSFNLDLAYRISVEGSGVYVAGRTDGALEGQTSAGANDAFVVRLRARPSSDVVQ